ncbi:restriction endonuclease subunit S [Rhodobacter capsulatus]|uniref:restriction endonuclease subunit S n=1 Tax=Rhodobacter capsulatus TaxID=1061 RepID=UPI0003D2B999|nr:restriction endonuclease subunit S [Rhodobacter capsulatus]ETD83401.1 restriction endonuclease [Rhodobacter capsulatus B6]
MSFVARPGNSPKWADDLPEGWTADWVKWSVAFASTKPTDEDTEKLPYISNEDIASWTGKMLKEAPEPADKEGRVFQRDDVLFNKLRPYLAKVYHADFDGISSGELLNLRASDRVLPRFLFHVLSSSAFIDTINAETFGTKMPRADWETVGHQPLPLPDIDTQRRIAGYLDDKTARIDALIEKKQALLDRLAEKRRALITRAITRGLNPTAPLKDSGIDWLGKVPAHWEVWPLKRYLTESQYGISDALSEAGEVAILRMGNIQNLGIDLTELKFVDEVAPFLLLKEKDVLFNRTNSIDLVGKSAIYKGTYDGALSFASYLARFRFDGRYLPEFANFVFGTEQLLEYARTMAFRAIGQANLNPTRFAEIAVPVPPVDEQKAIIEFLTPHGEQTEAVTSQITTSIEKLTEYRAALVTAAVTGKIKALLIEDGQEQQALKISTA